MCITININTGNDFWASRPLYLKPALENPAGFSLYSTFKNAIFNINHNLIFHRMHDMVAKKTGFLTEQKRGYLRMPRKERDEHYSKSRRIQFDDAIRDQAAHAIDDLILIAQEYDKKGLQKIFSKEVIQSLLGTLMDRIGLDKAEDNELYYQVILKVIEQRIHEKYKEQDRFYKLESTHYPVMPSKPAYRDVKAYMRK
jgi:hypothetical protein